MEEFPNNTPCGPVCAVGLSAIRLKICDHHLRLLGQELQKQPEFFIEVRLDGFVQLRLLVR